MKRFLMIPDMNSIEESLEFAQRYSLGFEYNDFFFPDVLDSESRTRQIIDSYDRFRLPDYCTLHGAFFDVIPFSADPRIKEISLLRIEQSLAAARNIGAGAVVFHTNYNPFLNSPDYIENWLRTNIEVWSSILDRSGDVNIYLENMFDTTPGILARLAEGLCVYDNFGICLDYAHASLSKVPPEIWAESLGRYVKHVHINDNDLVSDLHLAWGDGKISCDGFYRSYDKYLSGSTILIETSSAENRRRSVERLIADGFMD